MTMPDQQRRTYGKVTSSIVSSALKAAVQVEQSHIEISSPPVNCSVPTIATFQTDSTIHTNTTLFRWATLWGRCLHLLLSSGDRSCAENRT